MTGERLAWYKLASHLHTPLQEVKRKTSSREFIEWLYFLGDEKDQEMNAISKQEFYLASIAAEMRRSWVKNKHSVCLKDFLLDFKLKASVPDTMVKAAKRAKQFFFGLAGISDKEK